MFTLSQIQPISRYNRNIKNNHNTKKDTSTLRNIKFKPNQQKALVRKADKENTTFIIKEDIGNNKVLEVFTKNNILQLKSDPSIRFQKNIKNKINQCRHLFTDPAKKSLKTI